MAQKHNVGDIIVDRLEVLTSMEESLLGYSYLMRDVNTSESFLVKQLSFPCDAERVAEIESLIESLQKVVHKSISGVNSFLVDGDVGYVVLEFIEGETLEAHLQMQRERGQLIGLKAAYSFLAHMCTGVDLLHQAGYAYGCLSPKLIFVTREGRIRIANYVCACLAEKYLSDEDRKAYFDNPFVAPEVRAERGVATPCADVYSLALLFTELMSGISLNDFEGSPEAFIARLPGVSTTVKEALFEGSKPDAEDRTKSAQTLKDTLKVAVDAPNDNDLSSIVVGVNDLRALTVSADLPVIDMGNSRRKPDLFDSSVSRPAVRTVKSEVWIYQKDGMDYGPFDHKGLIQKFYDDEIVESTSIFNTATKKRQNLGTIPEFEKEVQDYIPIRDHNRALRESERRKKERKMKAAGFSMAFVVVGAIAAAFLIPIVILALMPSPKAINLTDAFTPFEKTFTVPKAEAVSLNVDEAKARAFFDPEATEAEREAALRAWEEEHRKKYASKRKATGSKSGNTALGEEIETLVFTGEDGVELDPLEDWEIEEQCMSSRMLRKVQECYAKHSGGRRVETTVNFTIQQTGTLRNVSTTTSGELDACLVAAFSTMKFRPFGGTVKKVSIPVGY